MLIALQRELRPALDAALDVVHPDEPELRGIYGIIWWQAEPDDAGRRRRADPAQRDRLRRRRGGPLAVRQRDLGAAGAARTSAGGLSTGRDAAPPIIVDSVFAGRVTGETAVAGRPAVITEVEGTAHLVGRSHFVLDPADPLGTGFLLR